MNALHSNPRGVGLAWRYIIQEDVMRHADNIDLLELPTEDYIIRQRRVKSDPDELLLQEILGTFPCVAHGISLSIGTVEPLNQPYLQATRRFLEDHEVRVFSEHLAMHRMNERDLTLFLPLPFEEAAVRWIQQNYEAARAALGRPFALENVTYDFPIPHGSLEEADFLRRITEVTDCTLLLDVTNVYNNAHNHGYDPMEFLDRLPLNRVSQLHIAGGQFLEGKWEDSHSHPVMSPVWELLDEAVRRSTARIVILERDSRFHPFDQVMEDVHRAREVFYRHRPEEESNTVPAPVESASTEVPHNHWDSSEHAELRAFQSALMGRITRPDFRERFQQHAEAALEETGVTGPWRERVLDCDPRGMRKMEDSWDAISAGNREEQARFEEEEWAAWAELLETT